LTFSEPLSLISYLILALFLVVLAMLYTRTFYGVTHLFHKLALPPHVKPAIGAFLSGLLGVSLYYLFGRDRSALAVMSFGYGILQDAMTTSAAERAGLFFALLLLAVALGKIVTTSLTIGSGGSGGVFGPSMVIGGCGGGALGLFLHWLRPWLAPQPASFVIVGMAGFFAAAAKTPFSTIVIVSEMTGNYDRLDEVLGSLTNTPCNALPVTDAEGRLLGVLCLEEAHLAAQSPHVRSMILAADLMRTDVDPLQLQDGVDRALELFVENDLTALPVVDGSPDQKVLGVVKRSDISNAYLRHVHGVFEETGSRGAI